MRPEYRILLVEDDDVDIMTIKRAMKDLGIHNPLDVAKNGEQALEYLRQQKTKLPYLILLDLNMPIMNGIEFLKETKKNEIYKIIPTVVLTTSAGDTDKLESFKNGAAGYIVKPVEYTKFLEVMKTIDNYWTTCENPMI